MKIRHLLISSCIMLLTQGVMNNINRSIPRTPTIQPGINYQQNTVQNRSLMGMPGMGTMGGMGGMNPMQQMGNMGNMAGMNPMQQMGNMGGMNPMQQMGGMNPMQQMGKNWSWGQNPMQQNMRKSGISHKTK